MCSRWTVAAARVPRRRLALDLLPGRALRGRRASRSATRTRSRSRCPFWNPLDWNVGYLIETLENFWHGEQFLTVFVRTFAYVAIALALSLAIGYPVAYFAARHAGRWNGLVPARADPAVLDQLPDADARVDQPAVARRLGHEVLHWVALDAPVRAPRAARAREAGSTGSRRRS